MWGGGRDNAYRGAPPTINTPSLPQGTVGIAYNFTMSAIGGTPPYTWAATGLPAGLGINSAGLITGTPTAQSAPTVALTATDALGAVSPVKNLTLTVNPAQQTGGFIAQPGFAVAGSFAWDGQITITDSSNRFGPNGPIMLVFDDFRNGTPGATMGPSAPVSGIGSWIVDTRSPEISPYIFGPANSNAAGTGPCVRALNNEVSGSGGVFARGMEMFLGGEYTQLYTFRNERWNGWNGRNNAGGGGGYYKMEWFLDDGSFGLTAFDMIPPVFIEGSTQLQPSNIVGTPTWSAANGGEVTVTVNTGGNCFGGGSSPPLIGATFTAQIGNSVGGNYSTFTPWVPAPYNGAFPGAVVTAVGGSPGAFTATFTYPLAANPGPVTTKGTLSDYGAYGTGVPSLSINTDIGGNSSGGHGLPTFGALNGKGPSSWSGTSFANDTWDQNGWNSIETMYLPDQTNPSTANGVRAGALYNAVNKQAYNHIVTAAAPLMGTPSPPWGSFNNWRSMGLLQNINANGAPITIDRSDHIVFLGNATNPAAARFMLHDQPTLAASTMIMPLTDYSGWSASSVTAKPRQGRFPSWGPAGCYLSFWDASNVQNLVGQILFDYYISTTGSDSNDGKTVATAWAITAINTKQSTYAGKRVGIIAGMYDVSGLMGTFHSPALNINGGTVAVPTVVAACDVNGNYSPRAVTLDAKGASGIYGGGNANLSTIIGTGAGLGGGPTPPNWGNWILDGIRLTGFSMWALQVGSYDGTGGAVPNTQILNCEIFGGNAASAGFSGVHIGPVELWYPNTCLIDNTYIHDFSAVGANSTHCQAITIWGGIGSTVSTPSINVKINRCTFANAGGIFGIEDTGFLSSVTVQQCYFDMTTGQSAAVPNGNAIMGFGKTANGGTGSIFRNNIVKGGSPFDADGASETFWQESTQYSNNTWDLAVLAGYAGVGIRFVDTAGHTGLVSCYNNLIWDNGAASVNSYGYNSGNVDAFALCDYNIYGTLNHFATFPANGGTPSSTTSQTFATWKTAIGGKEANSTTSGANPFTSNGARALAYQVGPGSPAFQFGRAGGVSTGAPVNAGAWDGIVTQIGSAINGVPD